jgi:hypothetical protein
LGFSGATRCCAGSFTELMPGDVQNDEAPTLFRERLEIGLDRNLDGLITGKNLDANRRIAKVNLVASSALSSNDGVWHGITVSLREVPFRAGGLGPFGMCLLQAVAGPAVQRGPERAVGQVFFQTA